MAEKLEVTTSESAFQLHLPSVVMNMYNGTNTYLGKRKLGRVMLHKNHTRWCMLMYNVCVRDVQCCMLHYVLHNKYLCVFAGKARAD